jgi:uncharacterized membrane protein YtjA (UPF0391 family)
LYQYRRQILPEPGLVRAKIAWRFNDIASGNQAALSHSETGHGLPSFKAASLKKENEMLYYALVFLLIAILAAVFGFGGIAIVSAGIAKILFFVFIVLFLVSLITHMSRRV